jgi:hypothetical protein
LNLPAVSEPPDDLGTAWLRRRLGQAVALSYAAAVLVPGPGLWLRRDHTALLGTVTGLPLSAAHYCCPWCSSPPDSTYPSATWAAFSASRPPC